ncbi:MFS transporter [Microvirga pudoricolor]|uniref:MFS transporter n=1 Tax=Microvirga pudoricolor TaxID=2778729 RepID=UPI00194FED26|nr:MFS transporter [Microvirga pudoricolor]MBM6594886.1 MFS transporter [Microvirga pudoricolor]
MKLHDLLARHGRVIGLGFGLTLLSSFGQTFFISLSAPDIRATFGITHGGFGLIYSAATLTSGLLMIWIGGVIDRVRVGLYVTIALVGLSLAAAGLSLAPNPIVLGLCLFGLRLFGQGMTSHAGITSTARLPAGLRGRSVAVAALGFPAGEAILPGIALVTVAALGWVAAWRVVALAILVALALGWALSFALGPDRSQAADMEAPSPHEPGPRWVDLLRDWRFLALMPAFMGYPAIVTAFFFHQRLIADMKGWSPELLASGITTFALVSVVVVMTAGSLVDRFGAVRLSHFYLIGLMSASVVLALTEGALSVFPFFALVGLTAGGTNVVAASVLAELFGTRHLGKIRALAGSVMVVASATTPGLVGLLFDAAVPLPTICLCFAAYLAFATAMTFLLPNPRA